MKIEVLELTKNSELVEVSIDEQKIIVGGLGIYPNSYPYSGALQGYANGNYNISSSGDTITFTPVNPGINTGKYPKVSYEVKGDSVTQISPIQSFFSEMNKSLAKAKAVST
jgi:hypothetical protein